MAIVCVVATANAARASEWGCWQASTISVTINSVTAAYHGRNGYATGTLTTR